MLSLILCFQCLLGPYEHIDENLYLGNPESINVQGGSSGGEPPDRDPEEEKEN